MVAQPALAYLMIFRSGPAQLEIFVGLFFSETCQRVLYYMPSFPSEMIGEKLGQAETFLSQMGFLMDNVHFTSATQEEKNELLRTLPFLYPTIEQYQQALRPEELDAQKIKTEVVMKRDVEEDSQRVFLERYLSIVSML